ncbi:hypothetical protein EGW08_010849 [Elysia chlorotica]|uniref:EF-hand domain-containing protein n=1 Tax=Elysia chlorotica TaxID=188477 RepID=A0A433TIR8_ELYCH|nr:hypothetical protein EGW08_010849 [Elysia chlorotica]
MSMKIVQNLFKKKVQEDLELPARRYGAKPELTSKQKMELSKAFGVFDPRGSGLVDPRSFLLSVQALGYEPKITEIDEIIAKGTSRAYNETIDFKDYYNLMSAKMTEDDKKEDILIAFKMFSSPETGVVTIDNLVEIAAELKEDISLEKLQEMIQFADKKGDGTVTYPEFAEMMERPELE